MDELIKALREKYIKDLTSSFSLYKVAIFLLFLIALVVIPDRGHQSLWFEVADVPLTAVLSTSSSFVSKILLLHIFLGVVLTYFTGLLYKRIQIASFNFFTTFRDFNQYINRLRASIELEATESQALNLYITKDFKDELKLRKASLYQTHIWGEIVLACSIVSLMGCVKFNITDLLIGLAGVLLIYAIQRSAFTYYTSKIVPTLVTEGVFSDRNIEFNSALDM
ncbi:hypothetical protein [Leptolyngbya sp. FACHB-711]|uniref:hypothetical protein n=1 Tax=unclassified Leptolyngbya TaxID=2650499 RepID=UPI0016891504|nr:hypothetical protein [Leptolyngbya sp. FACHB-711]MBD1848586.1 hypothetical protein [Cyanobacteria bacterium FACHB-502]MBD2025391.1 hypothetical protein [Leptolyngbya sp. FACHB-711]